MKTFIFSLQALLVLREQQEQLALHEYTRTLVARERAFSALHAAEDDLTSAWGSFHQRLEAQAIASDLAQLHAFCQTLDRQRQEKEHLAKVASNHTSEAFVQLLAARQARAVLEKYAENEKRRYQRLKRRHERKAMDDLPQRQTPLITLLELSRPALWN